MLYGLEWGIPAGAYMQTCTVDLATTSGQRYRSGFLQTYAKWLTALANASFPSVGPFETQKAGKIHAEKRGRGCQEVFWWV